MEQVHLAEAVSARHSAHLQEQETTARALLEEMEKQLAFVQSEEDKLKQAKAKFNILKEKIVAEGQQDADRLIQEAEREAAKIAQDVAKEQKKLRSLRSKHAKEMKQMELAHEKKSIELEKERAIAEKAHHERLAKLEDDRIAREKSRQEAFDLACKEREERLEALSMEEKDIQKRAQQLLECGASKDNKLVKLSISGEIFMLSWHNLVQFQRSVFFALMEKHEKLEQECLVLNGNPRYFHLVAEYLRYPS